MEPRQGFMINDWPMVENTGKWRRQTCFQATQIYFMDSVPNQENTVVAPA
jgi:hypothetical protein